MKFSCLQENLTRGISAVGHLALKASSLPVLANVRIEAVSGALTLSSTNLEAGIHATVRGKIEAEGDCLVPARLLLDLLPLLPGGPLVGELSDEGLTITTQNAVTTLRVHPAADFPIIPTIENTTAIIPFPREAFMEMVNRVSVAAGRVENRPQFNGILITSQDQEVIFAATDGFRLAEARFSIEKAIPSIKAIVPLAAMQEVARILNALDDEPEVTLLMSDNQIKVETASCGIISRLIEGDYPDYLPLFPSGPLTKGTIEAAALSRALKATTLFSRAGISGVAIEVAPESSELTISSENGDVGAHQTTLSFKGEGDAIRMVANARYILDAISGLGSSVSLQLSGAERPLLITPAETHAVSVRYLVMPIRQ